MSTYWAILEKIHGSRLRLTKFDDEILEHFNKEFPDFDLKATINEDDMKSKEGKERWRNFINAYEKKVEDYNFGTMLRANPAWEYGEKETIFGTWEYITCCCEGQTDIRCQLFVCNSTLSRSRGRCEVFLLLTWTSAHDRAEIVQV